MSKHLNGSEISESPRSTELLAKSAELKSESAAVRDEAKSAMHTLERVMRTLVATEIDVARIIDPKVTRKVKVHHRKAVP